MDTFGWASKHHEIANPTNEKELMNTMKINSLAAHHP